VLSRNVIYVLLLLLSVAPAVGLAPVSGDASSLKVRVQRLEFKTPVPLSSSERQKLTASLRRAGWRLSQDQTPEFTKDTAEELTREAYQDKGYFRANVSSELIPIRVPGTKAVALVLDVNPGRQYQLTGISWRGMTAFPESELEKLIPVHAGELFNRTKVAGGLDAAKKLYESKGFINFVSIPIPQIDDEAGTIAFVIDVDEGGQFHFGELDVQGMQEEHRRLLLSAWEGLRGQPFRGEEADKFFNRFFRSPLPNVRPEDYAVRHIDAYNHSVDYSLQLTPSLRSR
jgi:outer membrane protein insertion porin family